MTLLIPASHCTSKSLNTNCSRVNRNVLSVLFPGVGKVWIETNQQPEQACEFAEAVSWDLCMMCQVSFWTLRPNCDWLEFTKMENGEKCLLVWAEHWCSRCDFTSKENTLSSKMFKCTPHAIGTNCFHHLPLSKQLELVPHCCEISSIFCFYKTNQFCFMLK